MARTQPKTVSFGTKPTLRNPDDWVRDAAAPAVAPDSSPTLEPRLTDPATEPEPTLPVEIPMKRLTIDVPESLHRRIKVSCARDGLKIADVVRELLAQRFGESTL